MASVTKSEKSYKKAARGAKKARTVVKVGSVAIGGAEPVIMAGPCAVESRGQIRRIAKLVHKAGVHILRGGAFKPRTSPYSFQGLGEPGLSHLKEVGEEVGLPVISEIMDPRDIPIFLKHEIDILQVGARNMQNFTLLKELGTVTTPVLLKRGMSATIEDWLCAAEYLLDGGNMSVILCERGIRTFESTTRNTLDISAVPVAKSMSHLPVIVDPSHSAGRPDIVASLAKASIAASADGLLIDVHDRPTEALCDGAQAISPRSLIRLVADIKKMEQAI
jgi:3-deoxy-7-phosphoheptulonate synthase